MQEKVLRRSNRDRTEATRNALIAAARALIVGTSYAQTGTPEIADRAGVTRGALYHHFIDKAGLFRAVIEAECASMADQIEREAHEGSARDQLIAGTAIFIDAMAVPGRARLLLLEGPAVLGRAEMDEIDSRNGGRTIRDALASAVANGEMPDAPVDALADILSAAFDRAALAIDNGSEPGPYRQALEKLIDGLFENRA